MFQQSLAYHRSILRSMVISTITSLLSLTVLDWVRQFDRVGLSWIVFDIVGLGLRQTICRLYTVLLVLVSTTVLLVLVATTVMLSTTMLMVLVSTTLLLLLVS